MAKADLPTPDQLRQLLDYDPETGSLSWKRRCVEQFRDTKGRKKEHAAANWNARYAGAEVGVIDTHGYRKFRFAGSTYYAHRVAWAIAHGAWPDAEIDHINCDPADNRLANLRQASPAENARNKRTLPRSSTGLKGVYWHRQCEKWAATIRVGGKQRYIGLYRTPEEAHAAYCEEAKKLHGEFARPS